MSNPTPKCWVPVKFKDIFESYKYGPRFSSKDYDKKGNVKTIRGTDVSMFGDINYNQVPTARIENDIVENHALKNGDLIMITTADCGISGIFYEQELPYIASAYAIKLTPTNRINPQFIKYFMLSTNARNQVQSFVRKGTVANLPGSDVMHLRLNLPPLPEQQKIAKILSTWDKAISTTEALIDNSKQQKKALMQQLLTGKKRFAGFVGDWEDVTLKSISEIMTDYVANGSFQSLRENVVVSDEKDHSLYVRLTDLRVGLGHVNQKYTSKDSYEFLKKSCLFGGELLMANIGANVGEVWQMPKVNMPATLAPNMLMTKFKSCAHSKYIYYFLSSRFGKNRVSAVVAGSGHPKINKTELKQVKVLLPSFKEQKKIASVLTDADKEIEILEKQLADLKQEKKALMQQLLTGKRRVKVNESVGML